MTDDTRQTIAIPIKSAFRIFDQSFNRVKYFSCITNKLDLSDLPTEWGIKNEDSLLYSMKEPDDEGKRLLVYPTRHNARTTALHSKLC